MALVYMERMCILKLAGADLYMFISQSCLYCSNIQCMYLSHVLGLLVMWGMCSGISLWGWFFHFFLVTVLFFSAIFWDIFLLGYTFRTVVFSRLVDILSMWVSITDKSFLLKFILSDINISMQTNFKGIFWNMFFDL